VYVVPSVPAPAPAPAPAAKDFCPDLDGVQWENYDCNTPQAGVAEQAVAVVTAEAAPAVVPELAPTPASAAMPAVVPVPTEQTLPQAVDAGGGPTAPTPLPTVLLAAALLAATASGLLLRRPFNIHGRGLPCVRDN
jgi:hypothetical protein